MYPPEVGYLGSHGLCHPEGTWTSPPSHPEWAPVCPIPCQARLEVLRPQLYTTTPWEALSGYASWMGTPTWGRRSYRDEVPDLGGRAFLVGGLFLCGCVGVG